MNQQLDLRQLAIDRSQTTAHAQPRKRRIFSRYGAPATVLLGFLAMLGWAARERFISAREVTVVPVVVTRAEGEQAGTPLFQAAGWVEPRPTRSLVPALADGVVQELLVVEGQEVHAGDAVARLIDRDARLAFDQAKADLRLQQSQLKKAEANLRAARQRIDRPIHLEAAVAEAESPLAEVETELTRLPFELRAAQTALDYAEQDVARKESAAGALAGRLLQEAQSKRDTALAKLEELQARKPSLERQAESLRRRWEAARSELELKTEEARQLAEAEANLESARARIQQAELMVEARQLELERMVVRAPVTGRVLDLLVMPGSRVAGRGDPSAPKSDAVVSLYNPQMLQIRADVRLEDVPLVQPGQPVHIETASNSGIIQGKVLDATSQANVQKNTLEVKVAVENPPATLRPDMLAQVTFLAPQTSAGHSSDQERRETLLIPRPLVQKSDEGHFVWIVEPPGIARRRTVQLGSVGNTQLVEIASGLRMTDRLIVAGREGLNEGERIRITGDDPTLGISTVNLAAAPH
ncbi:MAG: efflux RND transporter periplasmic adaptor subunit [Pirellulaceae bacterium]